MGKSFFKPRKRMYAMYFGMSSLLLIVAVIGFDNVMLGWIASINFLLCLTVGTIKK